MMTSTLWTVHVWGDDVYKEDIHKRQTLKFRREVCWKKKIIRTLQTNISRKLKYFWIAAPYDCIPCKWERLELRAFSLALQGIQRKQAVSADSSLIGLADHLGLS